MTPQYLCPPCGATVKAYWGAKAVHITRYFCTLQLHRFLYDVVVAWVGTSLDAFPFKVTKMTDGVYFFLESARNGDVIPHDPLPNRKGTEHLVPPSLQAEAPQQGQKRDPMYTTGVRPGGVPPVSKRVFNKHDKDHSGAIDEKEFRSMCYDLGYHLSDLELKMAVKRLDMNGDGGISYEEFVHWWRTDDRFKILQLSEEEQESLASCAKYFRFFDKDDNGQLSREEFRAVHKNLVENNYTRKSFEELLADLDTDNDGHVSFNEYVQWLVRIGSLKVRHF